MVRRLHVVMTVLLAVFAVLGVIAYAGQGYAQFSGVQQSQTGNPNTGYGNGYFYGNPASISSGCAGASVGGEMKVSGVVINCVKNVVITSINLFFIPFSGFFTPIVFAMVAMAVCVFGMEMALNPQMSQSIYFVPRVMTFVIKIAMVFYFTQTLGVSSTTGISWPDRILGSVDDFANIVTDNAIMSGSVPPGGIACQPDPVLPTAVKNPVTLVYQMTNVVSNTNIVWNRMDCMFGRLIGVGPGLSMQFGIAGLIVGCLFSGTFGFGVFLAGFTAVLLLLSSIIRAVYNVASAYILIGFLLIISPLFVSMILFKSTYNLFEKWLDLLIGAILQPVLIFAFLAMFLIVVQLAIFGSSSCSNPADLTTCGTSPGSIPSLANALRTDFQTQWGFIDSYKKDRPLFSWRIPSDPQFYESVGMASQLAKVVSMTATGVLNKLLDTAVDMNIFYLPFVDWGAQSKERMRDIMIAFIVLAIICDLMLAFLKRIPELSQEIMTSKSGVSPIQGSLPGIG